MHINSQKGGVGIWVLVIIVIAVGGFFLFRKSAENMESVAEPITETTTAPIETIVIYDANGFSPNTATIKKGGAVLFQKKTGKPASVASGPHPTHLKYPEFDQYKTDQRGKDEFRFVFEKVGSWGYHDHLNATMAGTVVVTE